ncbi:MAG: endonuclease [Bacteroidales bacterium]|nr:endonuclease [Bacteroidales bacterium]
MGRLVLGLLTVALFWNVENCFDPFDNPLTADDDFTPRGSYHWTWKKFLSKRNAIAKTLIASSQVWGEFPLLVGLAEVENHLVLSQLVHNTALAKCAYGIILREGPDRRGINVALLYREELFDVLKVRSIRVALPDSTRSTRDILYVKGLESGRDTLHVFVVHFPSKLGGAKASEPSRQAAARTLSAVVDSLRAADARILVMGDFNDVPSSEVLREIPLANKADSLSAQGLGTLRYRGQWELIDHFRVSGALDRVSQMKIFAPSFLLEDDPKFPGKRPFRSNMGPRYHGGVSDHLPIMLKW